MMDIHLTSMFRFGSTGFLKGMHKHNKKMEIKLAPTGSGWSERPHLHFGPQGISAAILSKCTRDEGFIPVNKNLWSLSYITCMGCFSFLLLGVMYFVMDIKGWWGGQPFIYPGLNSIFVYVGHSLLGSYFPFSWEMRFVDSHWEKLFQSLWATSLWVLIAFLLYRKKFFLKI